MNGEINVCLVKKSDWEDLKSLWLEALKNDSQAFAYSFEEINERKEQDWKDQILRDTNDGNRFFIAETSDGEIVGMIGFFTKDNSANIYGVYVSPRCRGKQVGQKLLTELMRSIESETSLKQARLFVNTEQNAAVELYKRVGFEVVDEINDEIMGDGTVCNEYVMTKTIER